MWSKRAKIYEDKIRSGDPVSIAEVVRDLRRRENQTEQSYSERQMYQSALERLAREFAAIEQIDQSAAADKLEHLMDAA
jgi:CarD family transcriptional regulator